MPSKKDKIEHIDFQNLDASTLDYEGCVNLVTEISKRAAQEFKQGIRMGYKSKPIMEFFLNFPYCIEFSRETAEKMLKRLEEEAIAESTDENGNHIALRAISSRGKVLTDEQKSLIEMGIAKDWTIKTICEVADVAEWTVQKYRKMFLKTGALSFATKPRKDCK